MRNRMSAIGPMLLMMPAIAFAQATSPSSLGAKSAEASACKPPSLPSDVVNRLKSDFGSWKIQEPENLSEHARKTWKGKTPLTCPGIAVGLFQNSSTPSYAFL